MFKVVTSGSGNSIPGLSPPADDPAGLRRNRPAIRADHDRGEAGPAVKFSDHKARISIAGRHQQIDAGNV